MVGAGACDHAHGLCKNARHYLLIARACCPSGGRCTRTAGVPTASMGHRAAGRSFASSSSRGRVVIIGPATPYHVLIVLCNVRRSSGAAYLSGDRQLTCELSVLFNGRA